jgi:hypothetical protein
MLDLPENRLPWVQTLNYFTPQSLREASQGLQVGGQVLATPWHHPQMLDLSENRLPWVQASSYFFHSH